MAPASKPKRNTEEKKAATSAPGAPLNRRQRAALNRERAAALGGPPAEVAKAAKAAVFGKSANLKHQKRSKKEEDENSCIVHAPADYAKKYKAGKAAEDAAPEAAGSDSEEGWEEVEPHEDGKKRKAAPAEQDEEADSIDKNDLRVFVGGIPFSSDENSFRKTFEECGGIRTLNMLRDGRSGRLKGVAIITFKTKEAFDRALELDGKDFDGRSLSVEVASQPRRGKGKGKGKEPNFIRKVPKNQKRPRRIGSTGR